MGSTISCFWIKNTGTEPEILRKMMWPRQQKEAQRDEEFRRRLASDVSPAQLQDAPVDQREYFTRLLTPGGLASPPPRLAYRSDAAWLPYFETHLCSCWADGQSAQMLSRHFGAPVLCFALYDSDFFFVSYGDGETGGMYSRVRPNGMVFPEYLDEPYSTEFPAFLMELFPAADHAALQKEWEREWTYDADEYLDAFCVLLGLAPLWEADAPPEGFRFL